LDFKYHYTQEQERFRREVIAWLDDNLVHQGPAPELGRPADYGPLKDFRVKMGAKGWLAPTEPTELGGGGLSRDLARVLQEELAKRGMGRLLEDGAASLRLALQGWGSEEQVKQFLPLIASGRTDFWRHTFETSAVKPGAGPDPGSIGIRAFPDGDDYVLDGEGMFSGPGPAPDYLWTMALIGDGDSSGNSTAAFLVPAGADYVADGISVHTIRSLGPGGSHRVTFRQVRVPVYYRLGNEGDGWQPFLLANGQAGLLSEEIGDYISANDPMNDQAVAALLEYARETVRDGVPLIEEPVFQQLLMEAYINSRVTRLLKMRNSWMLDTGQAVTYQASQAAIWEKRAAERLSEIAREVAGIYALLDRDDPRSPTQGDLGVQQRWSLAQGSANGTVESHSEIIAHYLGLGPVRE
jgi:alkylation response protein AidB-like acyl-CoA dehydrogenase